MLSSLSSVPPVRPSLRPEIIGMNPPQAAMIGVSTRLTLSPTPPVECLSSTVPEPAISRVSDWLNYGEREYGETYSQAFEATDYDYQTLRNAAWVSSSIEPSRRREVLSWSHHAEVAALEQDEQDYWLDTAENQSLGKRELRAAIKGSKLAALPSPTERVADLQKLIAAGRKFGCIYAAPTPRGGGRN